MDVGTKSVSEIKLIHFDFSGSLESQLGQTLTGQPTFSCTPAGAGSLSFTSYSTIGAPANGILALVSGGTASQSYNAYCSMHTTGSNSVLLVKGLVMVFSDFA